MEASVDLAADPASVSAARRFVHRVLDGWRLEALVDAAALVASELVTNAVLHARTPLSLTLRRTGGSILLDVRDGSAHQPIVRHFSARSGTGRGLLLVAQISHRWGSDALPGGGKSVWCELSLDAAERMNDDRALADGWLDSIDAL